MSIKGKAAAKLAAKTGGKAVPGIGQAIMVVEGAPVALEEGTRAYQIFMEEKKKADKLAREGKPFRSIKAYYEAQAKSQSAAVKGIGRTAVTALVARQAADNMLPVKARKNSSLWKLRWQVNQDGQHVASLPEVNLRFLLTAGNRAYSVMVFDKAKGPAQLRESWQGPSHLRDAKLSVEDWLTENYPLHALASLAPSGRARKNGSLKWVPRPGEINLTKGASAEIPELGLLVVVGQAYPDGFRAKIWQREANGRLSVHPLEQLGPSPTLARLQKQVEDWIVKNYPLWALGQLAKKNSPKQDPDVVLSSRYPLAPASVQLWFNPEWTAPYSSNYANVYVLPNGLYVRWDEDAGPPNRSKGAQFVVFGPGPTDDIAYIDPHKPGFTLRLQKAGQMTKSNPELLHPSTWGVFSGKDRGRAMVEVARGKNWYATYIWVSPERQLEKFLAYPTKIKERMQTGPESFDPSHPGGRLDFVLREGGYKPATEYVSTARTLREAARDAKAHWEKAANRLRADLRSTIQPGRPMRRNPGKYLSFEEQEAQEQAVRDILKEATLKGYGLWEPGEEIDELTLDDTKMMLRQWLYNHGYGADEDDPATWREALQAAEDNRAYKEFLASRPKSNPRSQHSVHQARKARKSRAKWKRKIERTGQPVAATRASGWERPEGKGKHPSKPKSKRPWQARRNPMMNEVELYQDILAHLRALQWVSWTSHWTASGPSYYGDHQLLQRLYEGKGGGPNINEEIDGLGERMVAYFGPPSVNPEAIVGRVHQLTGQAVQSSADQFEALLTMETQLQHAIQRAWKANQASGEHMSLGIDDMLMGLANEREAAIYLLQRRLGGRKPLAGSVGRAAVAPPAIPESLRTVTPRVDLDESFTPQPLDRSFRAFSKSLPRPRLQAPELAAANPALPPGFSLQRGEHRGRPVFRIFRMGMDTGKYALRGERAAELAYKMAHRA